MKSESGFWDRVADGYSRRPIADEDAYRTKLEVTRSYFRPDMEVLEFGCGTGSTALAHAPFVKHIKAIDFSAKMIEIARGKAKIDGVGNVTFAQGDITTLDTPDQSYDAVLGLNILHLLKETDVVVANVYRMLKPGGVFVTSTACLGDRMWMLMKIAERVIVPAGRLVGLLPQLKVLSTSELVGCLTGAGFEIAHHWQPGKWEAVFIVARKAGRPS
jgi:ubiquinone/menaquinone biosynthesis C-methylase UbiE